MTSNVLISDLYVHDVTSLGRELREDVSLQTADHQSAKENRFEFLRVAGPFFLVR